MAGIAANVAPLACFKHAGFAVEVARNPTGAERAISTVIPPLAISFFTVQQVAHLVARPIYPPP